MTRTYTAAVNSYLSEPVQEFRLLADVTFANTTMRLWTGVGSLMVGATHYDGLGNLAGIDSISEDPETYTPTVKMHLSMVQSASLSDALSESLFNKQVILKRAWLTNGTLVNTPEQWFDGRMGEVTLYRGDEERGSFIEVNVQTRMDRGKKPKYYTREDLALVYSGDTFFDYLYKIQGQAARWGQRITYFDTGKNPVSPYGYGLPYGFNLPGG